MLLVVVPQVYERAVANLPPGSDKRFWRRYIYLWIKYALFEELDAQEPERAREVYRSAQSQGRTRCLHSHMVKKAGRMCFENLGMFAGTVACLSHNACTVGCVQCQLHALRVVPNGLICYLVACCGTRDKVWI